jgi:hypothetical protein
MYDPISLPGFQELVRTRAYALWESEGRPFGRDLEHWRMSEDAMRAEIAAAAAPMAVAAKAKAPARKKAAVRQPGVAAMSAAH